MNTIKILKEYADGLVIQWNDAVWVVKADGDQPSLYPAGIISTDKETGLPKFVIPKGTDVDCANAVASIFGLGSSLF